MSYIEGELVQTIDKHSGKAHFSLKMLEVSEPRKFRLFFDVKYFIYENAHYDRIITFPFMVSSNRKKFLIEQPLVFKINPTQGMCNEETEVWIKGLAFTERGTTHITFGGKSAKISETDDNLLMCYAPPIGNIEEDLVVLVEVMNTHPNKGELIATYKPLFTYLSEERPTNRTKDEMPQIFIPPSFQSSPNMPDFNDGHGSISGSKQSDEPKSDHKSTDKDGSTKQPSNSSFEMQTKAIFVESLVSVVENLTLRTVSSELVPVSRILW